MLNVWKVFEFGRTAGRNNDTVPKGYKRVIPNHTPHQSEENRDNDIDAGDGY